MFFGRFRPRDEIVNSRLAKKPIVPTLVTPPAAYVAIPMIKFLCYPAKGIGHKTLKRHGADTLLTELRKMHPRVRTVLTNDLAEAVCQLQVKALQETKLLGPPFVELYGQTFQTGYWRLEGLLDDYDKEIVDDTLPKPRRLYVYTDHTYFTPKGNSILAERFEPMVVQDERHEDVRNRDGTLEALLEIIREVAAAPPEVTVPEILEKSPWVQQVKIPSKGWMNLVAPA